MLKDTAVLNEKETRGGFSKGIYEAGNSHPNLMALTADLNGFMKLAFIKDLPERYFQ